RAIRVRPSRATFATTALRLMICLNDDSKFEANLAEVLLGFVILEGSDDFLQRKTAVDDGLQTIDRYRPNHVLLICAAANGDPADANLIRKQCRDRHFSRKPCPDADYGDMPASPGGCYRLRQRARSADLDDMIDAASI